MFELTIVLVLVDICIPPNKICPESVGSMFYPQKLTFFPTVATYKAVI